MGFWDFLYKGAIAGNPEWYNQAVGMPENYGEQQRPDTEGATQLSENLKEIGKFGLGNLVGEGILSSLSKVSHTKPYTRVAPSDGRLNSAVI